MPEGVDDAEDVANNENEGGDDACDQDLPEKMEIDGGEDGHSIASKDDKVDGDEGQVAEEDEVPNENDKDDSESLPDKIDGEKMEMAGGQGQEDNIPVPQNEAEKMQNGNSDAQKSKHKQPAFGVKSSDGRESILDSMDPDSAPTDACNDQKPSEAHDEDDKGQQDGSKGAAGGSTKKVEKLY